MLSAIEDKVRRRYNEQMNQNKAEIDILQQSQRELTLGKNKLESIMKNLNKEKVSTINIYSNTLYLFIYYYCK